MNRSFKISKRVLGWALLFLILLRPAGLVYIIGIERLSRVICLVISGYAILQAFVSNSLTKANIIYILMSLWLMFCTFCNGTSDDIYECCVVAISNIGMVCFISYSICKDIASCLKSMYVTYTILILLNFLYMVVHPMGYNLSEWTLYGRGYFLFGHQNTTITYVLPAICIALIAYKKGIIRKWQMLITILVSIGSIEKIFSATSLVGLVVFFGVLVLLQRGIIDKYLKAGWAILMGTGICVGIVVFNIQTKGMLADFIVNVLHRTTTLTSRTVIWEKAIALIKNNLLIGIGYKVNTTFQSLIHGSSAHNEYLFMLLQGGVILLVFFYLFFIVSKKAMEKYSTTYVSRVFVALYFSLFIQFLTETHMHRMVPLLALIGCADIMIRDELTSQNSEC